MSRAAKLQSSAANPRGLVQAYTALRESPGIIAAELAGVSGAGFQGSENSSNAEFWVRASMAAREATAMLCIEDNATLEMTIRLPASWPLRPAGVECKRKVGEWPLHDFFLTGQLLCICTAYEKPAGRSTSSSSVPVTHPLEPCLHAITQPTVKYTK